MAGRSPPRLRAQPEGDHNGRDRASKTRGRPAACGSCKEDAEASSRVELQGRISRWTIKGTCESSEIEVSFFFFFFNQIRDFHIANFLL